VSEGQSASPAPAQLSPPSSQSLIADALKAGRIDYPTSLLYRAYAAFGDGRLPDEFLGPGPADPDTMVLAEAGHFAVAEPEKVSPELKAFLVRPTDPASAFAHPATGGNGIALAAANPGGKTSGALSTLTCGSNGWTSAMSTLPQLAFKVWAQCAGVTSDFEREIATVVGFMDELWGTETKDMGEPQPDLVGESDPEEYGGDEAIDVYIVYPAQSCVRPGCRPVSEGAVAVTVPAPPFDPESSRRSWKSSAYMLVLRDRIPTASSGSATCGIRSDLAHEFFHVLQMSHNEGIGWQVGSIAGQKVWQENWFVEASATWAESQYVRDCATQEVYPRFTGFQSDDASLIGLQASDPFLHKYHAFIWPYFMSQQSGPLVVPEIWKALEGKKTWDDIREAIDARVSFHDQFREFAVRNLDQEFDPTKDKTLQKTYATETPEGGGDQNFPLDVEPTYQVASAGSDPHVAAIPGVCPSGNGACGLSLAAGPEDQPPLEFKELLYPLLAHYYRFIPEEMVKPDAPKVGRLVFDFSGLSHSEDMDVDLVVKVHDKGWERRKIDPSGRVTFCRNTKADHVDELLLVLSDHQKDEKAALVDGSFSVWSYERPCSGIVGTVTATASFFAGQTETTTMSLQLVFQKGLWRAQSGSSWSLSGSEPNIGPGGVRGVTTLSGGGPFLQPVPRDKTNMVEGWGKITGDECLNG